MDKEKKRSVGEYGHDDYEWGFKDDSEKTEWEEYYQTRNKKLAQEDRDNDE